MQQAVISLYILTTMQSSNLLAELDKSAQNFPRSQLAFSAAFSASVPFRSSLITDDKASGLIPCSHSRTHIDRVSISKPVFKILEISSRTSMVSLTAFRLAEAAAPAPPPPPAMEKRKAGAGGRGPDPEMERTPLRPGRPTARPRSRRQSPAHAGQAPPPPRRPTARPRSRRPGHAHSGQATPSGAGRRRKAARI